MKLTSENIHPRFANLKFSSCLPCRCRVENCLLVGIPATASPTKTLWFAWVFFGSSWWFFSKNQVRKDERTQFIIIPFFEKIPWTAYTTNGYQRVFSQWPPPMSLEDVREESCSTPPESLEGHPKVAREWWEGWSLHDSKDDYYTHLKFNSSPL